MAVCAAQGQLDSSREVLSLTEQELEQYRQRCAQLEQDREQVDQEMEKCQKVRQQDWTCWSLADCQALQR